jgi:hypothetical protein
MNGRRPIIRPPAVRHKIDSEQIAALVRDGGQLDAGGLVRDYPRRGGMTAEFQPDAW